MIREEFVHERKMKHSILDADLVVIGGGMAGSCCAITAARAGIKVVLVNDRPVLGGNASSEIRLWILGATSHMGNNNRWAREGGVIDEILVENTYRNPEGNTLIFDSIVLEKVVSEPNITLLLNTAAYEIRKSSPDVIESVTAFCSQNSTTYILKAPLFCDASGDGIIGFLSGAAFRMGAESKDEFGEKFAPERSYGELLGHSLYFYTKDIGRPVKFVPPSYALQDITQIPRYRNFSTKEQGCQLWWIEYGGRLDTVHDTEKIKWELWKVVYGVWNYIKNSGCFPEAASLTLEWVGTIPGKRESRRFEGDYIMTQQDVVEQRIHDDAVAFGGWSLDLHPADGVYSEGPGCNQWHSKGIYQIPFRSLYSKNIRNLFIAGRIISASHVAFASTRVMGTCAHGGQAVGMAAALCHEHSILPAEIIHKGYIRELQRNLLRSGQHIPHFALNDENNIVNDAVIKASSALRLNGISANGQLIPLDFSSAQMIPVDGKVPAVKVPVVATQDTMLEVQLRKSSRPFNHTPDVILETLQFDIKKGNHELDISFSSTVSGGQYVFICFMKNKNVSLRAGEQRITGIVSVFNSFNKAVSNTGKQQPVEDIGVDTFEFWCPQRRPKGYNIAMEFSSPIQVFNPENVNNGLSRPIAQPNAWVASLDDAVPEIRIEWAEKKKIREIVLSFDTDFDHPMESSLMGHPEANMPFCIAEYALLNDQNEIIYQKENNYQSVNRIRFAAPVETSAIKIQVMHPSKYIPAAVFDIRCYE